jgi:hypothetical protein
VLFQHENHQQLGIDRASNVSARVSARLVARQLQAEFDNPRPFQRSHGSISSVLEIRSLRRVPLSLSSENTAAASVDPTIVPNSRSGRQSMFRIHVANAPIRAAVANTSNVASARLPTKRKINRKGMPKREEGAPKTIPANISDAPIRKKYLMFSIESSLNSAQQAQLPSDRFHFSRPAFQTGWHTLAGPRPIKSSMVCQSSFRFFYSEGQQPIEAGRSTVWRTGLQGRLTFKRWPQPIRASLF